METLFRYLGGQRAYFLSHWPWHIVERVGEAVRVEAEHRRRYAHHEFVHLYNTPAQFEAFRAGGLNAVFSNQNCLIDERIFRPLPEVRRRFDAVYDARLKVDPAETSDVSAHFPEVVATLERALEGWLAEPSTSAAPEPDARTQDALRALGYVQ
jgi:hypothetical protein